MDQCLMEIGELLRQQEWLLVHFSAPTSNHIFAANLSFALANPAELLSFNTVKRGDRAPSGRGVPCNTYGSIGIVAAIDASTQIVSVFGGDSGSYGDDDLGNSPTKENCINSFNREDGGNEWRVKNFVPRGIFVLPPLRARRQLDGFEEPVMLEEILTLFPCERIFTANEAKFLEYDRNANQWLGIPYEKI